MTIQHIPDGYHTATPYLIMKGAAEALAFYQQAFGAKELFRMERPDGGIGHAEIQIGDSRLMLADEAPGLGLFGPVSLGGTTVSLLLYVEDVDTSVERAIGAGARLVREVQNQFYGDRSGTISDPFGHQWTIATHIEDVSPEEMSRRLQSNP